jgi:hypothetical protein
VSHICLIFWTCLLIAGVSGVNVVDMNGLFNTVSNYAGSDYNTGNSIMANGDSTILAVRSYKCSQGTCARSDTYGNMLSTKDLNGEVKCVEDNASCVLDGEYQRRVMRVEGTGSGTLTLCALSFIKGGSVEEGIGGAFWIESGAIVTIELCVFSNCRSTSTCCDNSGGGAIYVEDWRTTVNIYGTTFNDNFALDFNDERIRNDIFAWRSGAITIHNACPSPYSSNTPIQGEIQMRVV